jgi:hypothetical protein
MAKLWEIFEKSNKAAAAILDFMGDRFWSCGSTQDGPLNMHTKFQGDIQSVVKL